MSMVALVITKTTENTFESPISCKMRNLHLVPLRTFEVFIISRKVHCGFRVCNSIGHGLIFSMDLKKSLFICCSIQTLIVTACCD